MKATANNASGKSLHFGDSQPVTIWAFASPKGGPGKTTLAVAVGAELQRRAQGEVKLADLDYTANAFQHLTQGLETDGGIKIKGEHLASIANKPTSLGAKITEMANGAQFLILDTPGAIENTGAQYSLRVADVVIVPVSPSVYDFTATQQALELLAMISAGNPSQMSVVVVNKPEKTKIDQQVQELLADYVADKPAVYLAKTVVRKAVGFKESAASGLPLWALGSSGRNPTADIVALCDEILSLHQEHLNGQ